MLNISLFYDVLSSFYFGCVMFVSLCILNSKSVEQKTAERSYQRKESNQLNVRRKKA